MANNTLETLRALLQEWRNLHEAAANHIERSIAFSWDRYEKDRVSIQASLKAEYQHMPDEARASLSPEEKMEINHILSLVIDY